ncbi:MAG: acetyl-CoA acetyltransferase [Caulobacterales bacterium]|nr:acetyl-CoA acetyltransferase [Caulobacterales bacterium]
MPARTPPPDRTPVIFAIGEAIDRPADLEAAKEPVDLMAEALRTAEADSGARWLDRLDSLRVIGVASWRYKDPAGLVCDRLSIDPARKIKAGMGGEKPIRLIHEAALAIQRGESQATAIVGGEAQNAARKARRAEVRLPWTPRASREEAWGDLEDTTLGVRAQAAKLGVKSPVHIYPMFENAYQAKHGQAPTEGIRHSALIWAEYARASADNPYAWSRTARDVKDIAMISPDNRMISFPYPKLMVANDSVNQAAAVIVASLAFAREAGAREDDLIYLHGGASAREADDFLSRDRYDRCPALEAVLEEACRQAGGANAFDLLELYSCFPIVPKMALDVLFAQGLSLTAQPSVTGGLTFFGGPLNNYMTHAVCAMTRKLRADAGEIGLLYGQGGAMTKHHALIVSRRPFSEALPESYSVQPRAEAKRDLAPATPDRYEGAASIESYSADYGADGEPGHADVIARTPNKERILAQIPASDEATMARLTSFDQSAIGAEGRVHVDLQGKMTWTAE